MRVLAENIIAAIDNVRMVIGRANSNNEATREAYLASADFMLMIMKDMLMPEPQEIQFTPIVPVASEPADLETKTKKYIDAFSEYVNGAEE